MEIIDELKILAQRFKEHGYTLYAVGGFVRDHILSCDSNDIDITSNMPHDEVKSLCKECGFGCKEVNKNLGTLLIIINSKQMEYTRFRKESYGNGHTPKQVEFVDDIEVDTLRRDISINAIYLDILSGEYVDKCGGLKNIEKGIIRTANTPDITLKDDGLRILRIIRFASALNFKIERKTEKALLKYRANLKAISKERILKELNKILLAEERYGNKNEIGLTKINKLGLLPYIFNSTLKDVTLPKTDISKIYALSKDARTIGFYFAVLKNYLKTFVSDNQLMFTCNMMLGRDGIKESKGSIMATEKLFRIYHNLSIEKESFTASLNYLTLSNAEREIIDKFIDIDTRQRLSDNISYIKAKKLPLSPNDLPLKPADMIEAKIEKTYISKILSTLFNMVLDMKVKNTKDNLLKCALEINETFIKITKDTHK